MKSGGQRRSPETTLGQHSVDVREIRVLKSANDALKSPERSLNARWDALVKHSATSCSYSRPFPSLLAAFRSLNNPLMALRQVHPRVAVESGPGFKRSRLGSHRWQKRNLFHLSLFLFYFYSLALV